MEINDSIYGKILCSELIAAIVRTNVFQRLKNINQLGICVQSHKRFEHCIGTYHTATKFMDYLERNTPNLKISKFYRNCVQVSALLHDIGHGPFSHFWETFNHNYHHEIMAKDCVDAIFKEIPQNLSEKFLGKGIDLINAFITGEQIFINPKFRFLFEIVNNKQSNIDVDKWDYLKRDTYYRNKELPRDLKGIPNFDKVFEDASVTSDGAHIQYKYEHYDKIYNIFKWRYMLHKYIYRQPKVRVLENILREALKRAESQGATFKGMKYSEITAADMDIFLEFTDNNIINNLIEFNDLEIIKLVDIFKLRNVEEINLINNNNNNNLDIPDIFKVQLKLEPPGLVMPDDSKIHFYGNKLAKPEIIKDFDYYENKHYFRKK